MDTSPLASLAFSPKSNMSEKYTLAFMIGLVVLVTMFFFYNKTNTAVDTAQPGQYSNSGSYLNLTPMKHDMLKQLTLDFIVFFALFLFIQVGGFENFFELKDFLSLDSFREFRLSILGQSLIAGLGYGIYYQIVEPYVANRIPKF
jgi:hypothetical protein